MLGRRKRVVLDACLLFEGCAGLDGKRERGHQHRRELLKRTTKANTTHNLRVAVLLLESNLDAHTRDEPLPSLDRTSPLFIGFSNLGLRICDAEGL